MYLLWNGLEQKLYRCQLPLKLFADAVPHALTGEYVQLLIVEVSIFLACVIAWEMRSATRSYKAVLDLFCSIHHSR